MSTSDARREAEQLFRAFVRERGRRADADPAEWCAQVADGVQEEFLAIVEDYLALQEGRASSSSSAVLAGPASGTTLGDYRLLRELGRGGMGVVWEAEQLSLGRSVALKVLYPHLGLSDRWIDRFRQEAQAGGRLSHSGIVQVLAIGEEQGSHYIAQELVPGGRTLADWIQQAGEGEELPSGHFEHIARLFAAIADGLAAAHAVGVIHRDIKPGNILLDGDSPKVADFGLALLEEAPGLSRTGEMLGTAYYMSPEQISGRRDVVGPRSDVFSLGSTLYESLCNRVPFPGDTRAQVADKILYEDPPDPRRIRSKVPRDLAIICLQALAKSPSRRYADMAAFAEDLRRFLSDQPIRARPPGPLVRGAMWARRHPAVAAASAVAAVSLVVMTALFVDARAAWKSADEEAENARVAWKNADQEAENARTQQLTAEEIEQFLVGLFASVGPDGAATPDTPAGELLDRGVEQLYSELQEEPVVRAALLMTLGQVFAGLGENERAESLLRQALDLRQQHLGGLDQRTLKALNQLAQLLVRRAKYADAEDYYRQAQAGHEELYGADSPEALENQGNLAFLLWRVGRLEEAEPLLQNSLEGTRQLHGEDHFHTWSARSNLAALLVRRGKPGEAQPLLEQVVTARKRENGAVAPATLSALSLLAEAVKDQDKTEQAEALFRESLAGHLQTFGADHQNTANARYSLGTLLFEDQRLEQAEAEFRDCYRVRGQRLRPGHPSTLAVMANLVVVLEGLQRQAEALELARQLVAQTPPEDDALRRRQRMLDRLLQQVQD